jgi:cytochrome subunit of sulfide dehydrogenase
MSTSALRLLLPLAALAPLAGVAQTPDALHVKSLAATCAACHGTQGRATASSAVPALAGMPRDAMLLQLHAFRDGSRPATVMHQIAKGYTPLQLEQIAAYFAAQPK